MKGERRRERPLWGPEQAAERMIGKRYTAAIKKEGQCSACKFRERTFGIWHCQNTPDRQYPKCMDGKGVCQFTFDPEVLQRFKGVGRG